MTKKLAEEVKEPNEVKKPTKALSAYLEAYKLQNPVKFAAKLASGEFEIKNLAILAFAIIVGCVAVFGGVKAYQSYGDGPKVVVEGNYIESQVVPPSEELLGAMASPDIVSTWIAINGDVQYHIVAPITVGSSTLVTFLNPFGASTNAVIDSVRMDITTAASTTGSAMYFNCGADADGSGISALDIINIDAFNSSSTGFFENNLTAALGGSADTGTVAKIALNSTYPYFTCFVSSTASLYASTSPLAGKVTVVLKHTR